MFLKMKYRNILCILIKYSISVHELNFLDLFNCEI